MLPLRADWDTTWMAVADDIALRSACEGRQIGAVIVDANNRPISTGYNGPPAGFPAEGGCSGWCQRQQARRAPNVSIFAQTPESKVYGLSCPTVHAEANALLFADRKDYSGGTIYATSSMCADCAKLVANSGLTRVVVRIEARDAHRDPEAVVLFLRTCGLEVRIWET